MSSSRSRALLVRDCSDAGAVCLSRGALWHPQPLGALPTSSSVLCVARAMISDVHTPLVSEMRGTLGSTHCAMPGFNDA